MTYKSVSELAITYSGSTPSRQCQHYYGGGISWVKSSEVDNPLITETEETLTQVGVQHSSVKWVEANTPLIAMYGATAGKVGWLKIRATTNQAVLAINPKDKSTTSPKWLYWALLHSSPRLLVNQQGSGQPNLSKKIIDKHQIVTLPYLEQEYIARILDAIDSTIRKTEAIIEKLKQIKQGLLHDLLIRGIDANGELRPPPELAPQLYKESPLGLIPREWEIKAILEVGEIVTGSTPPSSDILAWGDNMPFVTPADTATEEGITWSERYISRRGKKYVRILPSNTTLVVCIGSTIGKTGITKVEACTNQQINAVIPFPGIVPDFLYFAITRNIHQLRAMAGLQAVPIVNKSSFGEIVLAMPDRDEQIIISNRLDAISRRIIGESDTLRKLQLNKTALMNDLLTGQVRVTPLLAENPPAP